MQVKKMSCVLKPRVSYNKIPKNCFKICNNLTRRHKKHKKKLSFNIDHPVNNIIPMNVDIPKSVEPDTSEEVSNSVESDTSEEVSNSVQPDTSEEVSNSVEPDTSGKDVKAVPDLNLEESNNETSIISKIRNSASNFLGLSTKGGKTMKKRKNNRKHRRSNKRKNKLKR